jgi:Beta-lactamase superfamily domain
MNVRCTLLGAGAMNSPRYRPAGLLVRWRGHRVALDGGGQADPGEHPDAWLVCDERAELMPAIRRRARELRLRPAVAEFAAAGLRIVPLEVRHTSHPTYGYLLRAGDARVVWAPEFAELPAWAGGADLMFADGAGWDRPIRFAGGVGGHADVRGVAEAARTAGVRRLVFAHIGRPAIRAIDRGERPPFGEWGVEGRTYRAGDR